MNGPGERHRRRHGDRSPVRAPPYAGSSSINVHAPTGATARKGGFSGERGADCVLLRTDGNLDLSKGNLPFARKLVPPPLVRQLHHAHDRAAGGDDGPGRRNDRQVDLLQSRQRAVGAGHPVASAVVCALRSGRARGAYPGGRVSMALSTGVAVAACRVRRSSGGLKEKQRSDGTAGRLGGCAGRRTQKWTKGPWDCSPARRDSPSALNSMRTVRVGSTDP